MCTGNGGLLNDSRGRARGPDWLFRPHRMIGGGSLIDPILHPNDPYNRDKNPISKTKQVQLPEEVERQPYRASQGRDVAVGAVDQRRRRQRALASGAQGDDSVAQTTGQIAVGG